MRILNLTDDGVLLVGTALSADGESELFIGFSIPKAELPGPPYEQSIVDRLSPGEAYEPEA